MKNILLLSLSCLYFLLFSNTSFAFGKQGHQLVCQVAFEHLSLENQDKVTRLLNAIPASHQNLINHYNYKKEGSLITFANACTWADAIKRAEKYKKYSAWHYINVSRDLAHISKNSCQKNCLPQAILIHQKQLADNKNAINWQRAQALLFLGHWLGDIHQPLHVSFQSDLGGNRINLTHLENKCTNLHWYWDECILYKGKHSKNTWLHLLNTQWQQKGVKPWQPEQVWRWADESYQITKSSSFHYCAMDHNKTCMQPQGNITLPDNYLSTFQPIIEKRLLLASERLTKILQASL